MKNGYPTNKELKKIRSWSYKDFTGLMNFVHSLWEYADWGWDETRDRYYISTGGWSGNEEIIGAMRANFGFWALSWIQSRRGGHYIFDKKPLGGQK